ncbi:hypothetical protein ABBQ38_005859 [Trebouxia sp. C0009 RCD-2024]
MEDGVTMPVGAYQTLVVRKICRCSWLGNQIPYILAALLDISPSGQVPNIVKKLTDACVKAEAVDLPKIAEHILELCSSKGHKALALQAVVDVVDALDAAAAAKSKEERLQLNQQQGKILQWLRHKLPTNADLAQGWLKQMKGRQGSASAFMLALLLGMSEALSRLHQPITDYLQVLVASGFQADHHLQRSAWLGKLPNAPGPRGAALQQALLTCITNTASSGDMTGQGRETGQGQEAGQGPGPGQGWQLASRPVIAFAVALLEKGNVRAAELADALSDGEAVAVAAPHVAAVQLGIKILVASFEVDASMRATLLRELQGRLVGVKEEVALPFVAVLGLLVQRHPRAVLEHANLLKAALDRFAFMTPTTALGVIIALQPLALLKKHIQAYMVGPSGVLRKALFSRGVASRLVAVRGLLYIIVQQLRTMDDGGGDEGDETLEADPELSLSQSLPASQQPSLSAGGGGVTLLHELMGLMRRSLTQQAPIREALYQGVHAILGADPSLQDSMLELLLPHFALFLQPQGPPLKLAACASLQDGTVTVHEPIDVLLTCVRQVLLLAQPRNEHMADSIDGMVGGETTPSILRPAAEASQERNPNQVLQGNFSELKQRLLDSKPEDFGLDKDCEWNVASSQGGLHQAQAGLLLGCLEVVIEDAVDDATGPDGQSSAETTGQQLTSLLAFHDSLTTWAVEGRHAKHKKTDGSTQGPSQKRNRPPISKAAPAAAGASGPHAQTAYVDKRSPAMSVGCLCRLLNAITDGGLVAMPDNQTQEAGPCGTASEPSVHAQLACSPMTQSFVLQSCLRMLHRCQPDAAHHAVVIGTAGDNPNRAVAQELLANPDWGLLAMPLIGAVQNIVQLSVLKGRSKGKQADKLPFMALQCLDTLLRLGRTCEGVAELLREVPAPGEAGPSEASTGASEAAQVIWEHGPLLHQMLQALLQAGRGRETEVLTQTIAFVGGLLPPALHEGISQWALTACEDPVTQVTHPGASKALISMHLSLAGCEDIPACMRVSKALEGVLGSSMGGPTPKSQEHHLQVTSKTGSAVATMLFTHMETLLHDVEWLVAGLTKGSLSGEAAEAQRASLETSACRRLKGLAGVLGSGVACTLKGPPCDHIARLLVTTYRLLKAVTIHYKAPQRAQQVLPCAAFQDMVSAVHQQLTPDVYHFIFDASNVEDGDQNKVPNAEQKVRRAKKEGKQMGLLVKAIEEWEINLIKLTRSCESCSYMYSVNAVLLCACGCVKL